MIARKGETMQVISWFLSIPLPLRFALLFLAGACLARPSIWAFIASHTCGGESAPGRTPEASCRRATGWIEFPSLAGRGSREASVHGRGFWIRPMLIELGFALGLPWLYWWEIQRQALMVFPVAPNLATLDLSAMAALHAEYAVHVALLALLSVATFIDFDEQTIPDAITVPGTLLALGIAVLCPAGALPWLEQKVQNGQLSYVMQPLRFDSPDVAIKLLTGFASLVVALACYLDWCGALLPRRWRWGVGFGKAWRIMWRRILARPEWKWVLPMAVIGCACIVALWMRDGQRWHALTSALIGMAAGGAVIWTIRFVASLILQREAMGFGDVTLMAMIGAFLGWQPMVIVFFLSPFAGALVGLVKWILIRDNVIPYGPFLCLSTLLVLVFWGPVWEYCSRMFEIHWLVPSALIACVPVLVLLLLIVRMLRRRIFRE